MWRPNLEASSSIAARAVQKLSSLSNKQSDVVSIINVHESKLANLELLETGQLPITSIKLNKEKISSVIQLK